MAREGSYAKGIAKRDEILTAALEVVARHGYTRATLRELADAVGLTQAGVLHYFESKEDLFTELLRKRDEVDLEEQVRNRPGDTAEVYLELLRHNTEVPGLMQLYVQLAAEATAAEGPATEFFRERYARIRAELSESAAALRAAGVLPPKTDPAAAARVLIAVVDGLQLQWLLEPDFDLAATVRQLLEAVGLPTPAELPAAE